MSNFAAFTKAFSDLRQFHTERMIRGSGAPLINTHCYEKGSDIKVTLDGQDADNFGKKSSDGIVELFGLCWAKDPDPERKNETYFLLMPNNADSVKTLESMLSLEKRNVAIAALKKAEEEVVIELGPEGKGVFLKEMANTLCKPQFSTPIL